ncbi:MAG TPA: hypothetical protein VMF64_16265 [Steroidobacteraceae bacterium]|nr:hypothetical protein [Steroidobacteraceae bacterium]
MEMLSARERVVAVTLLRRRPALTPGTLSMLDEEAYGLWYELVCSEIRRLAIVDQNRILAFCDSAGVPAWAAVPRSALAPAAA